jgi:hypothetical protein
MPIAIDYTKRLLHAGTLITLESKIQSAVANLNIALASNTDTASIISAGTDLPGPVLTSHVQIGNLIDTWDLPGNGPIRIRVCMPAESQGFTAQRRTQGSSLGAGMNTTIYTDIFIYFNCDLWNDNNKDREVRSITIAQSVVEDWIRSTFNATQTRQLFVASYEYGNPPTISSGNNPTGSDSLSDCMITMGSAGYFPAGTGNDQFLYYIHLIHSGISPT